MESRREIVEGSELEEERGEAQHTHSTSENQ